MGMHGNISNSEISKTLAEAAAEYIAARDAAREAERLESERRPHVEPFEFNGRPVYSLAAFDRLRPEPPMSEIEQLDMVAKIQRGLAALQSQYPDAVADYEAAREAALAHFEAVGAASEDEDDPDGEHRWGPIESLEVAAFSAPIKSFADVAAFLKLMIGHFEDVGGVNDTLLEKPILARLAEGAAYLESLEK